MLNQKCSSINDGIENSEDTRDLFLVFECLIRGETYDVTPEEFLLLAGKLERTMALGSDYIPVSMLRWLAIFFISVFRFMYVQADLYGCVI